MLFDRIYYSWLPGRNFAGSTSYGWGIASTSNQDPAFLKKAQLLCARKWESTRDPGFTVYCEYAPEFESFVYIGVKKLPVLPQMGGADNNRLIELFIPVSDGNGSGPQGREGEENRKKPFITIPFDRTGDKVPMVLLERVRLSKGGLSEEEKGTCPEDLGFTRENRDSLAVLLAMVYLSFETDLWKKIIIPIKKEEEASSFTNFLYRLLPESLFGKKREELFKGLSYCISKSTNRFSLIYLMGDAPEKENRVFLRDERYDAEEKLTKELADRKADKTAPLFRALADAFLESEAAYTDLLKELEAGAEHPLMSIQDMNQAFLRTRGIQSEEELFRRKETKPSDKGPEVPEKTALKELLFEKSRESLPETDIFTGSADSNRKTIQKEQSQSKQRQREQSQRREEMLLDLIFEEAPAKKSKKITEQMLWDEVLMEQEARKHKESEDTD